LRKSLISAVRGRGKEGPPGVHSKKGEKFSLKIFPSGGKKGGERRSREAENVPRLLPVRSGRDIAAAFRPPALRRGRGGGKKRKGRKTALIVALRAFSWEREGKRGVARRRRRQKGRKCQATITSNFMTRKEGGEKNATTKGKKGKKVWITKSIFTIYREETPRGLEKEKKGEGFARFRGGEKKM